MVCVRAIISFFTMLIFTRILGKQQLGQITFFDYIVGITIGSFAASLTVDLSSSAWPHWVGIATWIVLGVLLQKISLKSKNVSEYINDSPVVVVHDGKIIGDNLKKSKFTMNELLQQLRLKEIFDVNEVKFAIIETNGQLSTLKKDEFKNLIDSMNIPKNNSERAHELIFNGIEIKENLDALHLSHEWLMDQLKSNGLDSAQEVFYAFLDLSKNLNVNSYKDKIECTTDIFK